MFNVKLAVFPPLSTIFQLYRGGHHKFTNKTLCK